MLAGSTRRLALIVTAMFVCIPARAEVATVAVATNFAVPMQSLIARFEAQTGHRIVLVRGSTGQLYAQIVNGAPFDILLAADKVRPARLAENGVADGATQFTYAYGRLVLWSADPGALDGHGLELLAGGGFRHLAIASPELAPYGAAAKQALEQLGLWEGLGSRIAFGQNVGQAFAMAATGNAEIGLVALSQAMNYDEPASYVPVPPELHEPIEQDAILLNRGRANQAAIALMEFLKDPDTRRIIREFGYL